jgi:hypothetical protein
VVAGELAGGVRSKSLVDLEEQRAIVPRPCS